MLVLDHRAHEASNADFLSALVFRTGGMQGISKKLPFLSGAAMHEAIADKVVLILLVLLPSLTI